MNCPRSITFNIGPGLTLKMTELVDGTILFELVGQASLVDIRGLFFDVADASLLPNLAVSGADITGSPVFQDEGVYKLSPAVNMNGTGAQPFDAGIAFGTVGVGRDQIQVTSFVLRTTDGSPLKLDSFAHVDFGVDLGAKSGKSVVTSPAAPDAHDDNPSALEDVTTSMNVLGNDTDADTADVLVITDVSDPEHGTATIAPDGKSIIYTSDLNYSGPDTFTYCMSDGNGGTDSALATVDVIAVADAPALDVKILAVAGSTAVNEMIVRVSAAVTDTDGSEFIDWIKFSGLPANTQIVEGTTYDDPGQPGTIAKDFKLILEPGADYDFDLAVTAQSQEKSNGSEAETTVSKDIIFDYEVTQYTSTFKALNQSMWNTGHAPGFHETGFIGIGGDSPISGHFETPVPIPFPNPIIPTPYPLPGPLFADIDLNLKTGINYDIAVDTGSINADAPYLVKFASSYNRTTDSLAITPTAEPLSGAHFLTTSPTAKLALDFVLDVNLNLDVSLLEAVNLIPEDQRNISFDVSPRIVELGTNDISFAVPLGAGFTVNFAFPTFDANSTTGTGTATAHVTSNDIVHLEWDIIQALPEAFGIPGDFLDPITINAHFEVEALNDFVDGIVDTLEGALEDFLDLFGGDNDIDFDLDFGAGFHGTIGLIDADLFAALKVIQDLSMTANTMTTKLYTENGFEYELPLGTAKLFENASLMESNGTGGLRFGAILDPVASLHNNTDLGMDLGYELSLIPTHGEYNIFGITGSINLTPYQSEGRTPAPIPSIDLYEDTFPLNFDAQATEFFV
jgi:hypothetical protein